MFSLRKVVVVVGGGDSWLMESPAGLHGLGFNGVEAAGNTEETGVRMDSTCNAELNTHHCGKL